VLKVLVSYLVILVSYELYRRVTRDWRAGRNPAALPVRMGRRCDGTVPTRNLREAGRTIDFPHAINIPHGVGIVAADKLTVAGHAHLYAIETTWDRFLTNGVGLAAN